MRDAQADVFEVSDCGAGLEVGEPGHSDSVEWVEDSADFYPDGIVFAVECGLWDDEGPVGAVFGLRDVDGTIGQDGSLRSGSWVVWWQTHQWLFRPGWWLVPDGWLW